MKLSDKDRAIFGLGCSLLAALVLAWPVPFAGANATWGAEWDLLNNFWFFNHIKKCVLSGNIDLFSADIFYPFGYDLRVDLVHFFVPLASVPLQLCFSLITSYNILLIIILAFNCYTFYRLALALTGGLYTVAMACGIIWAASPLVLADMYMGSIELMACGFIPLTIMAFLRLWRRFSAATVAAAVASLVLTCLTNWFYGAYTMIVLAILVPEYTDLKALGRWCLATMLALVMCLPLILTVAKDKVITAYRRYDFNTITESQINQERKIVDGTVPFTSLPPEVFGKLHKYDMVGNSISLSRIFEKGVFCDPSIAFPRLPLLLAGCLGAFLVLAARRRAPAGTLPDAVSEARGDNQRSLPLIPAYRWIILGGLAFILCLGPYLRLTPYGDLHFFRYPLPFFYFYKYVPFFSVCYRAHRFVVLLGMALTMLTGIGIVMLSTRLAQRWPDRRATFCALLAGVAVAAVLGDILLVRHELKLRPVAIHVPPYYHELARDKDDYAIIEVPFNPLPFSNHNAYYSYYQLIHGKKTLNMTVMQPDQWRQLATWARDNRIIDYLLKCQGDTPPAMICIRGEDKHDLRELGFRYLILHTVLYGYPGYAQAEFHRDLYYFMAQLCGQPARQPGGLLVYDLRNMTPGDTTICRPDTLNPVQNTVYAMRLDSRKRPANKCLQATIKAPSAIPAAALSFWVRSREPFTPGTTLQFKWGDTGETHARRLSPDASIESITIPAPVKFNPGQNVPLTIEIVDGRLNCQIDKIEWTMEPSQAGRGIP